jgi:hypothetical protein
MAAGKSYVLTSVSHSASVAAWREAVLHGDMTAAGKSVSHNVMPWEKTQELPSGAAAGAVEHSLVVADNAALEIYDYPGEYAQRFDGVDPGGTARRLPNHRNHARVVRVKATTQMPSADGGICLHGPPHCGNPHCIVIAHHWDSLFSALKAAKQVSIVVEF